MLEKYLLNMNHGHLLRPIFKFEVVEFRILFVNENRREHAQSTQVKVQLEDDVVNHTKLYTTVFQTCLDFVIVLLIFFVQLYFSLQILS